MRQQSREPSYDEDDDSKASQGSGTNVAGPVSGWLILLFVALAIKFVVSSAPLAGIQTGGIDSWLAAISGFILGVPGEVIVPGEIILPLIIGAAIGDEVGVKAASLRKAEKSGLFNGVYASTIYLVGIIIIYEVLTYLLPSSAPSFDILVTSLVAVPIIICIALTEVFAILSYSRKVNG